MKKSSELMDSVIKQGRMRISKKEDQISKPELVDSRWLQKSSSGYTVAFYGKESEEKPKLQVEFLNLYEDFVSATKEYYGDPVYKTVMEKTTFSACVLNENSEQIEMKKKVAPKRQSFKQSLEEFLITENDTVSSFIAIAKDLVKKQIEKEEKEAQKKQKKAERKREMNEFKEAVADLIKDASHKDFWLKEAKGILRGR